MNTFLFKKIVYLMTVFTFLFVALGSSFQYSRAQGPCFTVSTPVGPQQPACSGPCLTGTDPCNRCFDWTIKAGCDYELPDAFKIEGNGGCFAVCSPNGEFNIPDYRVGCDPNPKWITIPKVNPNDPDPNSPNTYAITTTNFGHIRICAPSGTHFTITLVHHQGAATCTSPCGPPVEIFQP